MKHIFVLNPVAGRGDAEKKLLPKILSALKNSNLDYEIHRTLNKGDATRFVKDRCLLAENAALRFYAVGGDGTLNEVVNGAFGFENVEIALIPAGTGNDFPRSFSHPEYFLDIERQLAGNSRSIDLIRYNDSYLVNMLNIGIDCAVVARTAELKKKPFLNGSSAYLAGIACVFVANKAYQMSVTLEDGSVEEGEFTLLAVGNGAYCGGGFKGVPKACLDDGLLDVSMVKKINRRTFLAVIRKYHDGTHLEPSKTELPIKYIKCRKLTISSHERLQICADGEISKEKRIDLELLPKAIVFSVPKGAE
ncbi:MAG: diacylglycerol kinase family lipid kinase [Syntrophomonadaceae bacterium]|nr:diacylglycerol kinase family lipid kinase [Syntrophomonadaceae bacterium]